MADRNSYPQIPSTVWWGVRSLLARSPNATIDEKILAVQLGVQPTAARQYVIELARVGLIGEDGRATDLGKQWRLDESYVKAVHEILARAYPAGLLQVAPPGSADRQKVVSWFTQEGLGSGTAANKAATYMLISSAEPSEAPNRSGSPSASKNKEDRRPRRASPSETELSTKESNSSPPIDSPKSKYESIPLNVNIQIHIGADASADQIESIFSAMKRYLYDDKAA
jgi:hypothetical protein